MSIVIARILIGLQNKKLKLKEKSISGKEMHMKLKPADA